MKRKINWKNLILLIVMSICLVFMIYDLIQILKGYSFTWFGMITKMFIVFTFILCYYEIFDENE